MAALSAYLARFIPMPERPTVYGLPKSGTTRSCSAVGRDGRHRDACTADADGLVHALSAVQELGWVLRAILVKAWVEEAIPAYSPQGLLNDETADALRMCACLLDTPLPPMLEAHYPRHPLSGAAARTDQPISRPVESNRRCADREVHPRRCTCACRSGRPTCR